MSDLGSDRKGHKVGRKSGDQVFAALALLGSLALLSQLSKQTTWVDRVDLPLQPGFWPGLSLGGMTICALIYVFRSWREQGGAPARQGQLLEIGLWLRSIEFALWLMAYVFAVPITGYLATTIVFCVALTLRAGYRGPWPRIAAAALGFAIVLVFKSFLQVKIPGGMIYDLFPGAVRNVLILYF